MQTTLELIRHGEPVGGRRFRGNGVDDPLSELGWAQLREAVAGPSRWDLIVSSPLCRCRDFARELSATHKLELRIDDRLKEVGFGHWEGLDHQQVQQRFPEEYADFRRDAFNHRPTGAEPLDHFARRVQQSMQQLVASNPGKRLLLVCHAGVIRAAIATTLEIPLDAMYRIKVRYAAIATLHYYDQDPTFVSLS